MSKLKDMTIDELNEKLENPKQGITIKEIYCLVELAKDLQKVNKELQPVQYEKLTFWGKIKSVFSKAPVYRKIEKKEK